MRRNAIFIAIGAIMLFVPVAHAQDHGEVGAFVDYFRLHQTGTNFIGLGGRAGFNVAPYLQIEAEMSYDFNQAFTEGFTNTSGGTISTQTSNLRILHGLFGPKLQTRGPVRVFVTAKGGFTNFRFDATSPAFSSFTSSVLDLRDNNVSGAFYPGGGVEAFLGPFGLRAEVGDEMIFANGVHHNWKVTFGPQIRF